MLEWSGKKLTAFRTRDKVRRLQAGGSPKKFQRDAQYPVGFLVEMKVTYDFQCETFYIDK